MISNEKQDKTELYLSQRKSNLQYSLIAEISSLRSCTSILPLVGGTERTLFAGIDLRLNEHRYDSKVSRRGWEAFPAKVEKEMIWAGY